MIPVYPSEISEEDKEKYGRDGNPGTPKDVRGLPKPFKHINVKEYAKYDKESLMKKRDFQAERYDYYKEMLENDREIPPKNTEQHCINTMLKAEHLIDQIEDAMFEAGYIR